jgi:hypothetical protein
MRDSTPLAHRIPESAPVRRYFEELLRDSPGDIVVLVAEVEGTGFGSHGVILRKDLPAADDNGPQGCG